MNSAGKSQSGFIGNAKLIAATTGLSRLLAVARESVFANVFGAKWVMDSWVLAFMVPNLFRRLFGEGALSASFIPVYSEAISSGDEQTAQRLGRATFWLLVIILTGLILVGEGVIAGLGWIFGGDPQTALKLTLTAALLPYVLQICLVALLGSMLNARYHFFCPAMAPVVLNIFLIAGAVWATRFLGPNPSTKIFALCGAVLLGGVAELALVMLPLKRKGISLHWLWQPQMEQIIRIVKLTGPMLLGLGIMQINALLDFLWATWFSGPPGQVLLSIGGRQIYYPETEGAVSVMYFAQRLYNVPLGVFGIALGTALFPYFSACASRRDHIGLIETLAKGLRQVAFIGLAATVGLIILSRPTVEFILGGGLSGIFGIGAGEFSSAAVPRVTSTLAFYCLGIWAYCGVHVVARGFYALQDTMTPVKVGAWLVALNIPLNTILIWPLGTGGLALSTAICASLNFLILAHLLWKKIARRAEADQQAGQTQVAKAMRQVAHSLPKILLATAAMAAAAYGAMALAGRWFGMAVQQSGIRLGFGLGTGLVVFYLAAKLLGCKELAELVGKDS